MSSPLLWTPFRFFDAKVADTDSIKDIEITAAAASHGYLFVGDRTGCLTVLDNSLGSKVIDVSDDGEYPVTHVIASPQSPHVLVSLQYGETVYFSLLHFQSFEVVYSTKFSLPPGCSCVEALSGSPRLSHFAYSVDGHRVELTDAERRSTRCIYESPHAITGLHMTSGRDGRNQIYVCTDSDIVCLTAESDGRFTPSRVSDEGCKSCMNVVADDHRLAVLRDSVLSLYDISGLLESHQIDPRARCLFWFRNHPVVAFSQSTSVSLKIYELISHKVFGQFKYGPTAKFVLNEWSCLVLVTSDNQIVLLKEKELADVIGSLCSHGQYSVALSLAESSHMPASFVSNIHKELGDTRYQQKDYRGAIESYISCIGHLEPSYVITKFLAPEFAEYLIVYLEELHRLGYASQESTALRFNCYTKLRNEAELQKIVNECVAMAERGEEPDFDISSAVEILRASGFVEEAKTLARSFHLYSQYSGLLYDSGDLSGLFAYMREMPPSAVANCLRTYGLDLLRHDGASLVSWLGDLCRADARDTLVDRCVDILQHDPSLYYRFLCRVCPSSSSRFLWNELLSVCARVCPEHLLEHLEHPEAKYDIDHAFLLELDRHYQAYLRSLRSRGISTYDYPKTLSAYETDPDYQFRVAIEYGIDWLRDWDTAYNGVSKLWELICSNPTLSLAPFLADLTSSQLIYLFEGLRSLSAEQSLTDVYESFYLSHHDLLEPTSASNNLSNLNKRMDSIIHHGTPRR